MGVEGLLVGGSWLDLEMGSYICHGEWVLSGQGWGASVLSLGPRVGEHRPEGDPAPCGKDIGASRGPVCMKTCAVAGRIFLLIYWSWAWLVCSVTGLTLTR